MSKTGRLGATPELGVAALARAQTTFYIDWSRGGVDSGEQVGSGPGADAKEFWVCEEGGSDTLRPRNGQRQHAHVFEDPTPDDSGHRRCADIQGMLSRGRAQCLKDAG